MAGLSSTELRELCTLHHVLAALYLQPQMPLSWLGTLNQQDYAHLLLLAQAQTTTEARPHIDLIAFHHGPMLVHTSLLAHGTLCMLVYPFDTKLQTVDHLADAFYQDLESKRAGSISAGLLDGLRLRQNMAINSQEEDLLALFSAMPEADPSNEATQPFSLQSLELATVQKNPAHWEQIF